MLDPVKETLELVRCMVGNGAVKDTKEVCNAIADIAASIVEISKGVKPVAAVTVAEYRDAEKAGGVACLECGEVVQALGAHALKAHGMAWTAYVSKWKGWADGCGIELRKAGAALSAKRRDNALMLGLGVVSDKQKPKKLEPVGEASPLKPVYSAPLKKPSDDEIRNMTAQERQAYAGTLDDDDEEEIERILRIIDEKRGIINGVNVAHQKAAEDLADYIAANGVLSEYGLRWVKIEEAVKAAALDREALIALLEQKLGNKYGEMFSCAHPEGFTIVQVDTGGI